MQEPALIATYILAMVAANLLVWALGPWISPINAFLLIGLDLTLRDILHERISRRQMLGMILLGGAITWGLNPAAAQIALASMIAFTCSAAADWAAYEALRGRSWLARSNGSNLVGAAVDSALFPSIAFGAFLPHIILLQFAAKALGGGLWSLLLRRLAAPTPPPPAD